MKGRTCKVDIEGEERDRVMRGGRDRNTQTCGKERKIYIQRIENNEEGKDTAILRYTSTREYEILSPFGIIFQTKRDLFLSIALRVAD